MFWLSTHEKVRLNTMCILPVMRQEHNAHYQLWATQLPITSIEQQLWVLPLLGKNPLMCTTYKNIKHNIFKDLVL